MPRPLFTPGKDPVPTLQDVVYTYLPLRLTFIRYALRFLNFSQEYTLALIVSFNIINAIAICFSMLPSTSLGTRFGTRNMALFSVTWKLVMVITRKVTTTFCYLMGDCRTSSTGQISAATMQKYRTTRLLYTL